MKLNFSNKELDSDPESTVTTIFKSIVPNATPSFIISLKDVQNYEKYGYGKWTECEKIDDGKRSDLMPLDYESSKVTNEALLLSFFTITDIHITDKESPAQLIYLQQIPDKNYLVHLPVTSAYSPVMLYTTHVLNAAVKTINFLHKKMNFDMGISLGDTCNTTQYNETRWYLDIMDGTYREFRADFEPTFHNLINPSSGDNTEKSDIDYQMPFLAEGLDKSIPWYQALGNHDHFWMGSFSTTKKLKDAAVSDSVLLGGDPLLNPENSGNLINNPDFYMGVIDGTTPYGDIIKAGPISDFKSPPKVVADKNRRLLSKSEWMNEFIKNPTSKIEQNPIGHGFTKENADRGFASYSFVSAELFKVIVLDNTQNDDDGSSDIHGHGFLDAERYKWLKEELSEGQKNNKLIIIAAHIPIGVEKSGSELGWWADPRNAVTEQELINELHSYPNFILWAAGHRHLNTVKAFRGTSPESSFWQVETSSLRDFPQQFRTFQIYRNTDDTISIVTTNVNPYVEEGTPAYKSRSYAVAAQQIAKTNVFDNNPTSDNSIKKMPIGSYNAELLKKLTPLMANKIRSFGKLL